MPNTRSALRLTIPIAVAAGLSAVVLAPAHAQGAACNWYADTALKQQQRNELGKCGLSGPEWNRSRTAHYTWCLTQQPAHWKAEARKRERLLAGCKH